MTKLALINDLHFGVRGQSSIFLDHQEKFFSEIFFPELDKQNIKVILNLGDTFDVRKIINFVTLDRTKKFFFDEIQKRGIEYHMVVGNHCCYFNNTNEINSIELLLQEYPNFHMYINEPKELVFDNIKIMMVPWINRENQEQILGKIATTNSNFLFGHFEIKGFEFMKGIIAEHGLDRSIFSNFEGVYSGHFHHPSEYGNIKYLGAQYEMTWTDYAGRRGFHIFDCKKRKLSFVENTNHIFHKIIYDDTDMTIEDISQLDINNLKNTYIKVIVKTRTKPFIYDLFLSKLNEAGAADVKTIEDSLNLDSAGVADILDETKNTKDILHEYIDSIDTSVSKNKIKTVIDTLYIEASNLQ